MENYTNVKSGTFTIHTCDECQGFGAIFWGDNDNFDVEPCDCVTNEIGEY
jgi:hypothetical protein